MAWTITLVFGIIIMDMIWSKTIITKGTNFTLLPLPANVGDYTATLHVENDHDEEVQVYITGINNIEQHHSVQFSFFRDIVVNDTLQWPLRVHTTLDVSIVMIVNTWYGGGAARVISDPFLGSEYIIHTKQYIPNSPAKSFVAMSCRDNCNITLEMKLPYNYSSPKCQIAPNISPEVHDAVFLSYSNLMSGELIYLESICDLTGAIITSDRNLSVITGSYSASDQYLMIEHLFQNNVWGNEYLVYSKDDKSVITFTTIQPNTVVRVYDYHVNHFFNDSSNFNVPIESYDTVLLTSSKPISVFLTTSKSLITVAPFTYFANTSSIWCNLIDMNINITMISPYTLAAETRKGNGQYNPLSYYGHTLTDDACDVPSGRYGGNIDIGVNGGTMLNLEGNYVYDGNDEVLDTSLFHFTETEDTYTDTDTYGKGFVVPLLQPEELNDTECTQEIILYVILEDPPAEIEVAGLGNNTIDSKCKSFLYTSNVTLLKVTTTKDISLYVSLRCINKDWNMSYVHQAIPFDSFGKEYRTISFNTEESNTRNSFQMCYITSVYNETVVYIQRNERVILDEYESYKLNNLLNDITGLLIIASKPVGVVCGAYTYLQEEQNVTATPMAFASQVPPTRTWGKLFRIKLPSLTGRFQQMCISIVFSELYTTLAIQQQITTDDGDTEFVMYNMDVGANRSTLQCLRFTLQNNVSLVIRSSQPILITMNLKFENSDDTSFLILPPFEQSLEEVVHDFGSCNVDKNSHGEDQFIDPVVEFGYHQIAVTAMKMDTIVQTFVVTNQIPGDDIDNDGDGLVDEDFCQFLISDSTDLLFDLDFDGRVNEDCKGCQNGFELNSTLGCTKCRIGFYRNSVGVDLCVRCENLTTLYEGAVEEDQCVVNCFAGEEFNNDTLTCKPCAIGHYKNTSSEVTNATFHERWYCTECPDGKTTMYDGSISVFNCTENCEAGSELENSTGQCVPCGYNRYKPWSSSNITLNFPDRWFCMNCPNGMITMEDNATMCVAECKEGEEFNLTLKVCSFCQKGFFKNTTGNFVSCVPCPENTTTASIGSTTINDCKAGCFCPCNMVPPKVNYTVEEMAQRLEELRNLLAVDKRKLTSYIVKKHSAPDERIVSKAFGSLGVIVISGVLLILFLFDLMLLKQHFKMLIENIRSFQERTTNWFKTKKRTNQISPSSTETAL